MNKLRNSILTALAMISLFSLASCVSINGSKNYNMSVGETVMASGNIITKNMIVKSDFSAISIPSIVDVVVKQGDTPEINIKGSDNLLKYCSASVKKGILTVALNKEADNINFNKFDVVVYVTVKELSSIMIQGTGDVKFEGEFKTPELSLNIHGTGDIKIPSFKGYKLKAAIYGTGDIKMRANCVTADLSVPGTGDIDAELKGVEDLKASVTGTGDITLYGDTKKATYAVTGTGEIEAKKMIAGSVHATSTGTGDIECYATDYFHGIQSSTAKLKCHGNPPKMELIK